jgi:hypothetical protein
MLGKWQIAALVVGAVGLAAAYDHTIHAADRGGVVRPWIEYLRHGPGGPDIRACEFLVQENLKAPATYRRTEFHATAANGTREVLVRFDAENGMGVPIRALARCVFAGDFHLIAAEVDGSDITRQFGIEFGQITIDRWRRGEM